MNYPKISIVTPSFNQGQYLEKTILSVLNQNYPNLEYIIIDGGSTDNSIEIIKKYEQQLTYWVSEKDNGQSEAINKGLRRCTGDIVAWLNSDDYYESDTFKQVVSIFEKNPQVGLVYGACRVFYINSNEVKETIVRPRELNENSLLTYWISPYLPPQPSMFWLKKIQDKTTLLNEKLHFAMDQEFWFQLLKHTTSFKTDVVLSNYLVHIQSKSGSVGGFEKFIPEWKQVINLYLKEKSFVFRLNYFFLKFKFDVVYFFKKGYKKLPIKTLSGLIRIFKKVTGIKSFGVLTKKNE